MTALLWEEETPLNKNHDRNAFDCGEDGCSIPSETLRAPEP